MMLSELSSLLELELVGPDRDIERFALLRSVIDPAGSITYASSGEYVRLLAISAIPMAVVERRHFDANMLMAKSILVCDGRSAEETFFAAYQSFLDQCPPPLAEGSIGARPRIHHSAVIEPSVTLGDDVVIGPHVVILGDTVIGDRAVVKANATIGGEGFETKILGGRRVMIPHSGGVTIGRDVSIGASSCIDRGLFGIRTVVSDEVKIDNLVYIAHNVKIGRQSVVAGGASVLGSAVLGDGVWYGPGATCNHEVRIGDHAFVGTGAVVVRDVDAYALVAGSPAKRLGPVCACRTRLPVGHDVECIACGRRYQTTEPSVVPE